MAAPEYSGRYVTGAAFISDDEIVSTSVVFTNGVERKKNICDLYYFSIPSEKIAKLPTWGRKGEKTTTWRARIWTSTLKELGEV